MALTFTDEVKPLVTRGEPNPFVEVVKSIASKTTANGDPIGKATVLTHEAEDKIDADIARVNRQLSEAGKAADVTVRKLFTKVSALETKVSFWTIKRIERPAKAATPASTAKK